VENGLDPYLVASLIRQESEFNPGGGVAGQCGRLMQLLPKTGKAVASQVKLKRYTAASCIRLRSISSWAHATSAAWSINSAARSTTHSRPTTRVPTGWKSGWGRQVPRRARVCRVHPVHRNARVCAAIVRNAMRFTNSFTARRSLDVPLRSLQASLRLALLWLASPATVLLAGRPNSLLWRFARTFPGSPATRPWRRLLT